MEKRPVLNVNLDSNIFLDYYYLKEELIAFCKDQGMQTYGSKQQITERISCYLKTGKKQRNKISNIKKKSKRALNITLESIIEQNFVCSEIHRAFFKSVIGNEFKFNVEFQKYLKNSAGKTYSDAIDEWYRIKVSKKRNKGKKQIEKQFEYNTYIRDFYIDNKGIQLKIAIESWKYKKSLPGHNRYEKEDLEKVCAKIDVNTKIKPN